MDILNFISWIKGKRLVTSVDPTKTLIPVGLQDASRDDGYLAGAITVADFAAQVGLPYKVYTALLTQNGTSAPVPTVLQNTLGGIVTFTRTNSGQYEINSSSLFGTSGKCFIILGSNREPANVGGTASTLITRYNSAAQLAFLSMNTTLNAFIEGYGAIYNLSIEIRVYP